MRDAVRKPLQKTTLSVVERSDSGSRVRGEHIHEVVESVA